MAEKRVGTISSWADLAAGLAIFRLKAEAGTTFPDYLPGQYIALTRQGCKLTVKVLDQDGAVHYGPVQNADGSQKLGPVTHSYSIASAPFDTKETGELEIYVTLEKTPNGRLGRFTESLFEAERHLGDSLGYMERIVGNFTLKDRAGDAEHVVMVGTGTGLAPFVSMMKQVAHEAKAGLGSQTKFTLVHANRTAAELGYDEELRALKSASIHGFDFEYVRSVSRPSPADVDDPKLCAGRANNLLRSILGLPTREEELIQEARGAGGDVAAAERSFEKSTKPRLGSGMDRAALKARMPRGNTTVLTCGNADLMEDIRRISASAGFKYEMEEW